MKPASLEGFLIRAVLDEAFRELALTEPQRAFEEFDLTEEDREILRARDGRLLALLGGAATRGEAIDRGPAHDAPTDTAETDLPRLPEVRMLLHLVPQTAQTPNAEAKVVYAASVHPWPGDQEPAGSDAPNGAQSGTSDGGADSGVKWIIRIKPTVLGARQAGLEVAYSASIQPFVAGADESEPSDRKPGPATASPPWNHHVESGAARDAARAVRASGADGRYDKLLELIGALQTGDVRD